MKNCLLMMLSLAFVLTFAGCGTTASSEESDVSSAEIESSETPVEEISDESNTEEFTLQDCYLVTNVYGDGQKPWYVVLAYDAEIDPSSVSTEDYEVDGYEIEAVYTNSEATIPNESTTGSYVLLELSTDYTTTNYGGSGSGDSISYGSGTMGNRDVSDSGTVTVPDSSDETGDADFEGKEDRSGVGGSDTSEMTGDRMQENGTSSGRGSMSIQTSLSNQLSVTVQQTGSISSTNGTALNAWTESCSTDYTENVNLLVENFTLDTFTLSDGTTLMYSLYLPEDYNEDTAYPLVLFMPDATGEGSDEYLALTESLGGVIWTTEEWQSEHETIVLVPQYENSNTEDPANTMELVTGIVSQYSVDTSREYLVGQSSGTIRSIKLLIDYPDEFAGALLVAGQTDSAYTDSIADLASQNIWMICSEGDARAYPGMTEITEAVEAAGTEVTIAQWSAALADEEQEQLATEQASAGTTINWTVFDTGTVMRDDVTSSDATEHMNTWRVAYDLNTVREWLFEQTK
ncbi:MAG: hypothetical protein LUI10_03305 [Lachnospiraceae bacterium]|nr:hypothetical protein [Lachnospiraceae bacterium]